jgi:predicted transcriptional regulator
MAMDLSSGMTTAEVAKKHGVSAPAVSQFRTRFKVLLERFYEAA